uniref:Small ribosomal subunit protein uS3c n=1 Tax=Campanula zangezura TaxID=440380 RepID=A0A890CG61_9ASTR|nr:ribosomal protein S3 [Campanula zangezura]QRG30889.1 ribosomal protein S3 [Campanula zangezura]
MGQKINPLGLRLGTTQSHHSLWFAKPKNYSKELQEDEKIRYYIKIYVEKKMTSSVIALIRIEIEKGSDVTTMKIYIVPAPEEVFNKHYRRESKNLQPNLQKKFASVNQKFDFKTGKRISVMPKLNLTLIKIFEPYRHPKILAEFISGQLQERIPFRKAMKKAIELAKQAKNTKGIRVQIAGRLGGKEIARVEWIREGRVPLQTIQAKIDYCSYPIRTIYGVLGIKIWIFIDGE